MSADPFQTLDTFIVRLANREIELDSEKTNIRFGVEEKTGLFGKTKEKSAGTLGDLFSRALSNYQLVRNSKDSLTVTLVVQEALRWVNQLYALQAVKPTDGIYKKYEDCLEQIKKLTKEKKEIQDQLQQTSADLLESEAERRSLEYQNKELMRQLGKSS